MFGDDEVVERFTASMSLVIHSTNPFVPTVHANYRYFEFLLPDGRTMNWFAGGSDLTPSYVRDSRRHILPLHTEARLRHLQPEPTIQHGSDGVTATSTSAHRQETRGIGGIFMDDLTTTPQHTHTLPAAHPLTGLLTSPSPTSHSSSKHHTTPVHYSDNYHFQQLRRGRYVEFNLMYDKGTSVRVSTGECEDLRRY